MSGLTGFSMDGAPHPLGGPRVSALLPEHSSLLAITLGGNRNINLAQR